MAALAGEAARRRLRASAGSSSAPQRHARERALDHFVDRHDLRLHNLCAGAIVNSALGHLAWLALPPQALRLEALLQSALGLTQEAEAALLAWDVEQLYREIDDREPPRGGRGEARRDAPRAARARALGQAQAADLQHGYGTVEAPEDEAEPTRLWQKRLLRGHAGDGSHSLLRALLADLPRSRTPWEQVLRTQLAQALAQRPGLSWSRPSRSCIANHGRAGSGRRLPWEPGTTASRRVPTLALAVDVSGSIDGALMQRFAREIQALSRRLEAPLTLIVGDDRLRSVETFAPGRRDLRSIRLEGGGGTDFTPLPEEVQRQQPDIAMVLTDLQGPARLRPACPVIWAVPAQQPGAVPPLGRRLLLH